MQVLTSYVFTWIPLSFNLIQKHSCFPLRVCKEKVETTEKQQKYIMDNNPVYMAHTGSRTDNTSNNHVYETVVCH